MVAVNDRAALDAKFQEAENRISQADAARTHKDLLGRYSIELYGLQEQANKGDNMTERPRTSAVSDSFFLIYEQL